MTTEDSIILGLIAAFFGFIIFFILVGIVFYILNAIGLFQIAKREGKGDIAWLAWVPIANLFVIPLLVENDVHEDIRGKFTLISGIAYVVSFFLGLFTVIFSFLYLAVYIYGFYFLAKRYSTNPVLHLVIAIITIGMSTPIQVFMFRKRERLVQEEIVH